MNADLTRRLPLLGALAFASASLAQAPMPHRSIWGSVHPAGATVTAEIHLEYWCPPMTLIHYCTIQVTMEVGDDACTMCQKLADVINNDPCCIQHGYVATCDEVELVVEGTFNACPGGWLCFDPAGVFALRKSCDMAMIDVMMPLYLSLFGEAGGVSLKPGAQASALAIYTGHYPGEREPRPFLVEVPTTPGMSASTLAQAIYQGFVDQGVVDVELLDTKIKFHPATKPPAPPVPTLEVRVGSEVGSATPCTTVEVWAKFCNGAFGLAGATFDVLLEGAGSWSNLQTYPAGFAGANPGVADATGVHGIVVGQTNDPGQGLFPDYANPLLVWSGQWCPEGLQPCTPVATQVGSLDVFVSPGGPIAPCSPVQSDSAWIVMEGATCESLEPGAMDVLFYINDTSLNYVLASSPTLLCQVDQLYCEDNCKFSTVPPGSCFIAHAEPGCDETPCCLLVCEFDLFCCVVTWDGVCVDEATVFCVAVPGDLNGDGTVDGADLGLLLSGWGLPGPTDLDGSGVTDGADLGLLLANWGSPGP